MAKYTVDLKRTTASTTLALGVFQNGAANARRLKIYEMNFGSDDTPSDDIYKYTVDRVTADGGYAGSTAVTPRRIDDSDPVSFFDAGDTGITVNPTIGDRCYAKPLNQRASHRWVAAPGSELVCAASIEVGFAVQTPVASIAHKVNACMWVEEV